jgi:hypothetical protein
MRQNSFIGERFPDQQKGTKMNAYQIALARFQAATIALRAARTPAAIREYQAANRALRGSVRRGESN